VSVPTRGSSVAPHEPTSPHAAAIARWAAAAGLRLARLDEADAAGADVVLVDRVGVLGDLYAVADIAYVGGGFHRAGLHSVLEPAAFGVPVLFGPLHGNSRDAEVLLADGGAQAVATREALAGAMLRWLDGDAFRADAGARARAAVVAGVGAAERSYALLAPLLDSGAR
jgi:3-deoxy-D-manno-octulosonic-acid transferase